MLMLFLFCRVNDFHYCPAILNIYSTLNLTIKSKSVIGQKEQFSVAYPLIIKDISKMMVLFGFIWF